VPVAAALPVAQEAARVVVLVPVVGAVAVAEAVPLYVEGGSDAVVRVVVKYKGAGQSSWKRIDLKKLDSGWGGLIPCADVTQGALKYYVQGFDDSKEPVANNGDTKHPYTVAIKSSIDGEAPHLPGKDAPQSCEKSSDCPPDFPGCSKSGESAGDNGDDNGEGRRAPSSASGSGSAPSSSSTRCRRGATSVTRTPTRRCR
jgi:hypothetical protein